MVEELTETEVRQQLEVNLLGTLWVTQAALPVMRAQGYGRVLQVTSEGGVRTFTGFGAYHASKWAVEGLSQTLAAEVAPFGLHVTLVEPGPYVTGFGTACVAAHRSLPTTRCGRTGRASSAATRGRRALPSSSSSTPTSHRCRLFLGQSFDAVQAEHLQRLQTWRDWQDVALAAFR